IMGEPLSPDRVFEFLMDEPHPAYEFFAPGPLPGYAGRGVDGHHSDGHGLAVLFGDDDDSSDDDFEGPEGDEEVWEVNDEWLMTPITSPLMPVMPPPSTYEVGGSSTATAEGHSLTLLAPRVPVPLVIEDLYTRIGNLEYGHGQLVKKVITMSDAEVADSIAIGEIGPRVSTVEGQMQVMASQMVQVMSRLKQVGAHVEQAQQAATQRDETIAGFRSGVSADTAYPRHGYVVSSLMDTVYWLSE
ncbi:hypothetical protein Tco_1372934, partial [Tanacetum coccineum]